MLGFLPVLCGQSFKKSRCKKLLKICISRIQLLKNRRAVQVNQLRRDVAQLLQFGQEQSARTRLARLWKEQNLLSAYDTIGQFCKLVLLNLANIGGQRSCPADLVEPLSSLIFAASSCADLPELQDFREILATKYGNELQSDTYVNEGILGSFSSRGPTEEAKQKLLEGIAKEYNLSPRFRPRIGAPSEDLPGNVEKISVKRLAGPLEDHRGVFSFPESNRSRDENDKFRTPPSVSRQDVLNSCGRDVGREQDGDLGRTRRVKTSRYRREDATEHADGYLGCSQNLRRFDRRDAKVIDSSGLDESHNGELFQPAGSHDSQAGKARLRSVNAFLEAPDGGFGSDREEADFSVAANCSEALMSSNNQSSYGAIRADECDFNERKNLGEFHDGRHQKEARSRGTRGIMDRGEVTLVLCSPTANDNDEQTEAENEGSISLFIPKTTFPEPPRRPPPPPPVRVSSSPSLYVQSPPKVSYQRSSTLETYRFEEHRDGHVHPKLPEYDDLVARFAALKLKTLKQ